METRSTVRDEHALGEPPLAVFPTQAVAAPRPEYTSTERATMRFDVTSLVEHDPWSEEHRIWDAVDPHLLGLTR